jgi:addiction module HigA family antidote
MLLKEFLEPLNMTQSDLARRIGVSWPRINEIVNGKRGVTPDTALRFGRILAERTAELGSVARNQESSGSRH